MAQQTEAACLLESGALYGIRVMLCPTNQGDPIFAGYKLGAFSLYYGDAPIYHFDREGRWQRAFVDGTHYLKGLDTTTQAIDRVREGENLVLKRRTLSFAESSDLDASIRSKAIDLIAMLGTGQLERVEPPAAKAESLSSEALRDFLERIAGWDAAAWFAHREKYLGTYGALPFLPPDSQNALILQATLGHADGIAFGGGLAAPHYVRSGPEFAEHVREVVRLYGQRLLQYRNIFLAGSDVLRRLVEEVAGFLETIAQAFPNEESSREGARGDREPFPTTPRLEAVHCFLDNLSSPRPTVDEWRSLRDRRLSRVILGVESGDPTIRSRCYGKGWENQDLVAIVSDLKKAELGVGVVVLVGAGGEEAATTHLAATAELILSLDLGPGDIVSLLDANEIRDPGVVEPGLTPLVGARWTEQQVALKQALLPVRTQRKAKVVPYSLEKQGL